MCEDDVGHGDCCWACWTEASSEVGGGSCGGETCGVIMAGSLACLVWADGPCLSSRDAVTAGVSGGECIEGGVCEEWSAAGGWRAEVADWVREAGEGEAAWGGFVSVGGGRWLVGQTAGLHEMAEGRQAQRRTSPCGVPGSSQSAEPWTDCAARRRAAWGRHRQGQCAGGGR